MNKLSIDRRAKVITALVEGNSIRATCRMANTAKWTVIRLLASVGAACARYQGGHLRNLPCQTIQCDEIWSFCYAKEKNPEMTKKQVRDTLIKHDFDFQGRKPGQAVHMAWVNLGYAAKEALQKDVHRLALLGIKKERNEKEGVVYIKCPCCDKYRGTPKDVANHIKGVFDEIHTEWLETQGLTQLNS